MTYLTSFLGRLCRLLPFLLLAMAGFAQGPPASPSPSLGPLPAKLITFYGFQTSTDARQSQVVLCWVTAHEDSGTTFAIEYAPDGSDFHLLGHATGSSQGTGSESYRLAFTAPDRPLAYYRLHIRDDTGHDTYSPVISINLNVPDAAFWPNPFTEQLHINQEQWAIHNVTGKLILRGQGQARIDTGNWPPGLYLLQSPTRGQSKLLKK